MKQKLFDLAATAFGLVFLLIGLVCIVQATPLLLDALVNAPIYILGLIVDLLSLWRQVGGLD
jgi:hypothetical protein